MGWYRHHQGNAGQGGAEKNTMYQKKYTRTNKIEIKITTEQSH